MYVTMYVSGIIRDPDILLNFEGSGQLPLAALVIANCVILVSYMFIRIRCHYPVPIAHFDAH